MATHPERGAGNNPEPWGVGGVRHLGPTFITSLAKEVMFLVALVSLSVCLSVDNITQKVMNGLG